MRSNPIPAADEARRRSRATAFCGLWLVLLAVGCGASGGGETAAASDPGAVTEAEDSGPVGTDREQGRDTGIDPAQIVATPEDWRIAREKVRWAASELAGGDTSVPGRDADSDRGVGSEPLEFGELVGAIGESFVGSAYVPHTLEVDGPERLVVNLQGLDCVTFVETVLTLAHLARTAPEAVDEPERFERLYAQALTDLRYRSGLLDGYPSRLHYFSDWIVDNAAMGQVTDLTRSLGGTLDPEPIDFMSTHPDSYPQLADPESLASIRSVESRLNSTPHYYIPEDEIAARAAGIRTGDVIAATSTVAGLDVAHTGLAVWRDGDLLLLHAPLVGESVQLSASPIADRILRFTSQDGILVARPVDPLSDDE